MLDTLRFQVLLAILFETKVTVPECWMVSSPAFLRVFNEVDQNFPKTILRTDIAGSIQVNTTYPFRFVFFDGYRGNPEKHFINSLLQRMKDKRRIVWLSTTDEHDELARLLERRIIEYGDFDSDAIERLADELPAILEKFSGNTGSTDLSAVSIPITNLLKRLGGFAGASIATGWGASGFSNQRGHVAQSVANVQRAVFEKSEMAETHQDRINEFRMFFEKVAATGSDRSSVMEMWPLLDGFSDELKSTAEAFGRLAINRAYSRSTKSSQGAMSFAYYSGGHVDEFTKDLLCQLIDLESAVSRTTASTFLQSAPLAQYDLVDTIEWEASWKDLWETAANIAIDPSWQEERQRLEKKIFSIVDPTEMALWEWNELFDLINARFQDLRFELVQSGQKPAVRILRKELTKTLGKEAINGSLTLIVSVAALAGFGPVLEKGSGALVSTKSMLEGLRFKRSRGGNSTDNEQDESLIVYNHPTSLS